jgi:hypothetical protein
MSEILVEQNNTCDKDDETNVENCEKNLKKYVTCSHVTAEGHPET